MNKLKFRTEFRQWAMENFKGNTVLRDDELPDAFDEWYSNLNPDSLLDLVLEFLSTDIYKKTFK